MPPNRNQIEHMKESSTKILIVDDSPLNITLLKRFLSKMDYDISTADNGTDAIHLIHNAIPDLVLLDLMMPGISGYEVLESLRDNQSTSNLPVVVISALDEEDDIRLAYEKGASAYLQKPVKKEELINKVLELIPANN